MSSTVFSVLYYQPSLLNVFLPSVILLISITLQGLGTSTSKEGKEYFQNITLHKKDFVWEDDQDGEAIELAFSKKKIEARKKWLLQFEV